MLKHVGARLLSRSGVGAVAYCAAAIVSLAVAVPAHAAAIEFITSTTQQYSGRIDIDLTLKQFHPKFGTLTSIDIAFLGTYNGYASTTFDASSSASTSFQVLGILSDANGSVDVEAGAAKEKTLRLACSIVLER